MPGVWSGWFLIIRSPGSEAALERKEAERAG